MQKLVVLKNNYRYSSFIEAFGMNLNEEIILDEAKVI